MYFIVYQTLPAIGNNLKLPLILHSFCILNLPQETCLSYAAKKVCSRIRGASLCHLEGLKSYEVFRQEKQLILSSAIPISLSTPNLILRISPNCGNALKIRIAFTPTNVYDHTYICKEIYIQVILIMSAVLWR